MTKQKQSTAPLPITYPPPPKPGLVGAAMFRRQMARLHPVLPDGPLDVPPDLLLELSPLQQAAVETLARRLEVDTIEMLRRLITTGLHVVGLDQSGAVDASLVLGAAVQPSRFEAQEDRLLDGACEAWASAVAREAEERYGFAPEVKQAS